MLPIVVPFKDLPKEDQEKVLDQITYQTVIDSCLRDSQGQVIPGKIRKYKDKDGKIANTINVNVDLVLNGQRVIVSKIPLNLPYSIVSRKMGDKTKIYCVLSESLGAGSFGKVKRAFELTSEELVSRKIVLEGDFEGLEFLKSKAQYARKARHKPKQELLLKKVAATKELTNLLQIKSPDQARIDYLRRILRIIKYKEFGYTLNSSQNLLLKNFQVFSADTTLKSLEAKKEAAICKLADLDPSLPQNQQEIGYLHQLIGTLNYALSNAQKPIPLKLSTDQKKIIDGFQVADAETLIMPLAKGENLQNFLKANPSLPLNERILIAEAITAAFSKLHQHNIAHRDIKPKNINIEKIVDKNGNISYKISILDYGLSEVTSLKSSNSDPIGTPGYMAPELIVRSPSIDLIRTDIYSMGVSIVDLFGINSPIILAMQTGKGKFGSLSSQYFKNPDEFCKKFLGFKTLSDYYSDQLDKKLDADFSLSSEQKKILKPKLLAVILDLTAAQPEKRITASEAQQRIDTILTEVFPDKIKNKQQSPPQPELDQLPLPPIEPKPQTTQPQVSTQLQAQISKQEDGSKKDLDFLTQALKELKNQAEYELKKYGSASEKTLYALSNYGKMLDDFVEKLPDNSTHYEESIEFVDSAKASITRLQNYKLFAELPSIIYPRHNFSFFASSHSNNTAKLLAWTDRALKEMPKNKDVIELQSMLKAKQADKDELKVGSDSWLQVVSYMQKKPLLAYIVSGLNANLTKKLDEYNNRKQEEESSKYLALH